MLEKILDCLLAVVIALVLAGALLHSVDALWY
jgi:hypothetical protein